MTHGSTKHMHLTRGTLLSRVRDVSDQAAWQEFVADYGPQILGWCSRLGLQETDCADVVQDVLVRLVTAMRSFEYDPQRGRFRSWLKTVTRNAVLDFVKHHNRPGAGTGDEAVTQVLNAVQDPDAIQDLSTLLEQQAELELLREAEARVKLRVRTATWQAWQLSVREQLKAPAVARKLNIEVADVYVSRSRVNKLIREELQRVNAFDEDPSANGGRA